MYETRLYTKGERDDEWRCQRTAENDILRNAKARVKRWMNSRKRGEDRCGRVYEYGELVYEFGSLTDG